MQKETCSAVADLEDNHHTTLDRLCLLKDWISKLLERVEHVDSVLERSVFVQRHILAHVAALEKIQEDLKGPEALSLELRAALKSLSSPFSV